MRSTFEQIRTALSSAYPITVLVSPEEDRQEKLLRRFAASAKPAELPVIVWNCVDGFLGHGTRSTRPDEGAGMDCRAGPEGPVPAEGFRGHTEDRHLRRGLRDTAMKIRNTGRFLFLLQQTAELPEILKPMSYIVMSMFPDEAEIKGLVISLLGQRAWTRT